MSRRTSLPTKSWLVSFGRSYVCPSCSHRRAFLNRRNLQVHSLTQRHFSRPSTTPSPLHPSNFRRRISTPTLTQVTAVNAPRPVPPKLQRLDQALSNLEQDSVVYTNTSQLRLAIRGLETADPVTRIAILWLDSRQGAARLVRAILADPLAKEPAWERRLAEVGDGDGKAMIIRHGETFKLDDGHPFVETLYIPSALLQTHRIEILIHGMSIHDEIASLSKLLVPSLDTAGSYSGRMSYPVHKVLIYTHDLGNLPAIGNTKYSGSMVQRVVNGTWAFRQPGVEQASSILPVNVNMSERAITIFRESLDRATEFEHTWFESGISNVASWLPEGTNSSPEALKPVLRRLIESHSSDTARSIQTEEDLQLKESRASEVPVAIRDLMEEGITIWAENAHTELRDRLNSAFLSKTWGRTKWWKLFWRVDEVGFVALNILNRTWLVDAEKEMIWIFGRLQQSGLLGPSKPKPVPEPAPTKNTEEDLFGRPSRKHLLSDVMDEAKPIEPDEEEPILLHPWPQNISLARSALSRVTVPTLQALSQSLMLQAISTTFLTSTLSALIYIGVPSTSLYSAGAIAAVGLVYSLRQLQKKWEDAREMWKKAVWDNGVEVLRREEQLSRDIIKRGGDVKFDFAGEGRRRAAREALDEVRSALDAIPVKEN